MHLFKFSIYGKLRKQMDKAIHRAKSVFLSPESLRDQEEMTRKEMQKRFPHSQKKGVRCKLAAAHPHKKTSKRTAPGTTENRDSAPSCSHKEGARWMKTKQKQIQASGKRKP